GAGSHVGPDPESIAVRDLNGDGKLDLAVVASGGSISVLLGKGDGTFQPPVNYNANASSESLAVVDLNGDGKLDLVLPNNTRASVSVLLGNGDGTFGAATNFGAGLHPYSVAVGDFDGDGKPDLAVTSATIDLPGGAGVSVLLNTCASAGIHLSIVRSKTTVTLSWPLPYTNFVLESTASFNPTIWQTVVEPQMTNNGRCEVIVP